MDPTTELLQKLSELYAERDKTSAATQALIDKAIEPVAAILAEIREEAAPREAAINAAIAALEDRVKAEAIDLHQSISTDKILVKFTAGRVTWDNAALEGYAATNPEINQFKKQGKAYASIERKK